ncbi:AMP-binding protein [Mycolicibacterium sp. XJ1819]
MPAGQIGTVYFEREVVPFEYHNDPDRTAETRHPDHPTWTTSGDIGYLDEDGYLYLTDRKSFTIISGGVNIYPQEIENALALHPAVFDVAVIGVPDDEMGESVVAVVHPASKADRATNDELAATLDSFLRERIAHYKVPRRYEFDDDLPRTPTGKLVKGRLRERYAAAPSYARGESNPPLLEMTIPESLRQTAVAHPDREALVDVPTGRRWTYREFCAQVQELAVGLMRLGLAPGDRIGIWAPNCAEWVLTQYAAAECGVILVTINPAYRQHELEYTLNHADIRVVIAAAEFRGADYVGMLDAAKAGCPRLDHAVIIGSPGWADLSAEPSPQVLEALAERTAALSADDPINIQYTSGTTGAPKGATLSHRNILNNGYLVGELCNYTAADRICIPVPFYHCFGMVMGNLAATTHGSTMVIPAAGFDAAKTLAAVEAEKCTSLYGVPTMFIAELNLPDFDGYDLRSLRTGIMAGSPCPAEVMRQVIDKMHMAQISICYGMTETSPVSTQTRTDDAFDLRVGTVGRAGPHLEIKIVDPDSGEVVPRGVPGEFCTRGYSVMLGYWNEPDKTAEVLDADGWMHTGDLAVMDADGYVKITGRIKDMVIRGGENIYPREVEEFLYTHPDILDAQVIGVPDDKYGEVLMAWVRLRAEAKPFTAAELKEFATGKISSHKIPQYVHFVDEFPMTVTGKVRKVEMREMATEILAGARAEG